MEKLCSIKETADQWLQEKRNSVSSSTYIQYHATVRNYILPALGNVRPDELDQKKVISFLDKLSKEPSYSGKILSPSSISNIKIILGMLLRYGEEKGMLLAVRFHYRVPGRHSIQGRCFRKKDVGRVERMADGTDDARFYGMILCLDMGLRLGELCALQWSDIDLHNAAIYIKKTVKREEYISKDGHNSIRWIIGSPKSPTSYRIVPIPRTVLKNLKHLHEAVSDDASYFLNNRTDRFVQPRSYQRSFKNYLAKMNIDNINLHSLRHSFATRCLKKTDVKTVSELLGHSSPSVTMSIYIHTDMEDKRKAVNGITA